MANTPFRLGPTFIASTVGNLLNPGTTTGGVGSDTPRNLKIVLRKVTILNKTASPVTFTCYIGATGGSASGTEVFGGTRSVAANGVVEIFETLQLRVADFLTGVASSASALVILGEGEIFIE